MMLPLIAVPTWVLLAIFIGPETAPPPPDPEASAQSRTRRSPFHSGPVKDPADPVERLYQRALRFKTEATFLGRNDFGQHYLDISDLILERIVTLQPDHGAAYQLLGEIRFYRAASAPDRETRHKLVATGNDQFSRAEKCPRVDWTLYRDWGQRLALLAYQHITDRPVRHRLMRQAVDIVDRGVARPDLEENRGDLLLVAGLAAAILAENQEEPAERARWYRQSIRNYDRAQELGTKMNPFHTGVLAEALFQLSDLANDAALARRSIEYSQSVLERDPKDVSARYNLVCAYAVLGENYRAVNHLEACAATDPSFLKRAAEDPLLEQFRASGEYAAFLETIRDLKSAE